MASITKVNNLKASEMKKNQPVDIFNGLGSSIALANDIKTKLNAHYADAGASGEEHIAADTAVSTANAQNEGTLIALVSALQDSYDAHDADAELGAAWVYHQAQEGGDASLSSTTNPTTIAEAVVILNDLKAKLNTHMSDGTAHTAGDSTAVSVDDAVSSIEITDSYQDICNPINVKGAKSIILWIDYDRGDSVDMTIQALVGPDSSSCNYEFVIETVSADKIEVQDEDIQVGADVDLKFVREFVLNGAINYIKFQVKDNADGTGQIDSAKASIRLRD